jgi:hypothetical protein
VSAGLVGSGRRTLKSGRVDAYVRDGRPRVTSTDYSASKLTLLLRSVCIGAVTRRNGFRRKCQVSHFEHRSIQNAINPPRQEPVLTIIIVIMVVVRPIGFTARTDELDGALERLKGDLRAARAKGKVEPFAGTGAPQWNRKF